jgi:transglutaminase-like putative cysteine protease
MADDIRHGRYWLLAVQLATIAPQLDRLPAWLLAFVFLACFWRLPKVELRLPPPDSSQRFLILLLCFVGLWFSYHSIVGPEAGTSFLIVCMAIKLLEMRSRRDCHIVVILGFFVVSTNFLFDQSLWLTLYAGLVLVLIAGSLLVMHQPPDRTGRQTARHALLLVGQALPLMLILYLFFPRLPPLWTMHMNQSGGKTGLSDSMSPGEFAHLSQSDALAFRVEFHGAAPDKSRLYWRALVLANFDGKTWRPNPGNTEGEMVAWLSEHNRPQWLYQIRVDRQHPIAYRVVQEPNDQPWLFGLGVAQPDDAEAGLTREYTLLNRLPVTQRKTYEVTSFAPVALDADMPDWLRSVNLRLPPGNPRARAQAVSWRNAAASDADYVSRVLDWYRGQNFAYTLDPPPITGEQIDGFLFQTRQGFCEHYASSFVFLMRAAGIPARIVAGYQGGQPGASGGYWEVRQMDAHAWAEIWLPGQGWTELDPTAAVAPERINRGASSLADNRDFWGNAAGSGLNYSSFRLLRSVHAWMDDLNYRWNRNVLGYDTDSQNNLMQRLIGDTDYLKRTLIMVGCFAAVLALLVAGWWWRQPRHHDVPPDRYYRLYCRRMARAGLPRQPGEGPVDYAGRVAMARPDLAKKAREVTLLYTQLRYQPASVASHKRLLRLRRLAAAPVKPGRAARS